MDGNIAWHARQIRSLRQMRSVLSQRFISAPCHSIPSGVKVSLSVEDGEGGRQALGSCHCAHGCPRSQDLSNARPVSRRGCQTLFPVCSSRTSTSATGLPLSAPIPRRSSSLLSSLLRNHSSPLLSPPLSFSLLQASMDPSITPDYSTHPPPHRHPCHI